MAPTTIVPVILLSGLAAGCVSSGPPALSKVVRAADREAYARHLEASGGDPRQAYYRWKGEEEDRPIASIAEADRQLGDEANPFEPRGDRSAVSRGGLFYETYCASCHGVEADGRGEVMPVVLPRMNFHSTSRRFAADYFPSTPGRWFRSVEQGKESESDLVRPDGSPYAMPAFGEILAREQIWLAVTYLLSSADDLPPHTAEVRGFP